jgi:AcrR family transcriptional regulator
MGHRHTKEEILEGALAAALEEGLSQLTFGRLAKRLGINDRTIVYYFPSKDDLISEVIVSMGLQLQEKLAAAFTSPAGDHIELLRTAWPILARTEVDQTFALFFEANGLAATRRDPYQTMIPMLIETWIEWTTTFLKGSAKQRRTEAETAIAVLDGLFLLRLLTGPAAAQRAARRLGIS